MRFFVFFGFVSLLVKDISASCSVVEEISHAATLVQVTNCFQLSPSDYGKLQNEYESFENSSASSFSDFKACQEITCLGPESLICPSKVNCLATSIKKFREDVPLDQYPVMTILLSNFCSCYPPLEKLNSDCGSFVRHELVLLTFYR